MPGVIQVASKPDCRREREVLVSEHGEKVFHEPWATLGLVINGSVAAERLMGRNWDDQLNEAPGLQMNLQTIFHRNFYNEEQQL